MSNLHNEVLYLSIQELFNKYGEDREVFCLHLSTSLKIERYLLIEYFEDLKIRDYSEDFFIFCLEQFLSYDSNFINSVSHQIIKHCILYDLEKLYSFSLHHFTSADIAVVRSLMNFFSNFHRTEEKKYIPKFLKSKAINDVISDNFIDSLTLKKEDKEAFKNMNKLINF